MSHQKLPPMSNFKAVPANFDIAMLMNNHKRKIDQLNRRRNDRSQYHTLAYRDMFHQNPKRNYMLQTKYTEIERQNRLLFEKISGIGKNKRKSNSFSQNHMGTLNTTFRKQQIEQIQNENVKIFSRIQNQKASISFRQTDKDYFRSKSISQRLSNLQKRKVYDWYS